MNPKDFYLIGNSLSVFTRVGCKWMRLPLQPLQNICTFKHHWEEMNEIRQHFKSILNDIFRFGCCCCCCNGIDDGSYGDGDGVFGLVAFAILHSASVWKSQQIWIAESLFVFSFASLFELWPTNLQKIFFKCCLPMACWRLNFHYCSMC